MKVQTTILILAANPLDTDPLRLEEEVREIELGLQFSKQREYFQLQQKWAVRPTDLRRALLTLKPNIVHFSGHGKGDTGLVLENAEGHSHLVATGALSNFFKLFSEQINCVLLNACYSITQAEAIAEHIDYVIGIHSAISDKASIEFAVAFYDALGAGESIEFAFDLACNALELIGCTEANLPVLLGRKIQHHDSLADESGAKSFSQVMPELSEIHDIHFLYQEKISLLSKWKELGEQVLQLEAHLEANAVIHNRHVVERLFVLRKAEFASYLEILQTFMPISGFQNTDDIKRATSNTQVNFAAHPFKNHLSLASLIIIISIVSFWSFTTIFQLHSIPSINPFSTPNLVSGQQDSFFDDYSYPQGIPFNEQLTLSEDSQKEWSLNFEQENLVKSEEEEINIDKSEYLSFNQLISKQHLSLTSRNWTPPLIYNWKNIASNDITADMVINSQAPQKLPLVYDWANITTSGITAIHETRDPISITVTVDGSLLYDPDDDPSRFSINYKWETEYAPNGTFNFMIDTTDSYLISYFPSNNFIIDTTGSYTVEMLVVDSGVDYNHPDLISYFPSNNTQEIYLGTAFLSASLILPFYLIILFIWLLGFSSFIISHLKFSKL